jgi:hypothetical protein
VLAPLLPGVLVHHVGLDVVVGQRGAVQTGQGVGLELVSQPQQVGPAALQLAGQPRGRLAAG